MDTSVLRWKMFVTAFIVYGVLVCNGVSGRTTIPPSTPANSGGANPTTDAPQVTKTSIPLNTSANTDGSSLTTEPSQVTRPSSSQNNPANTDGAMTTNGASQVRRPTSPLNTPANTDGPRPTTDNTPASGAVAKPISNAFQVTRISTSDGSMTENILQDPTVSGCPSIKELPTEMCMLQTRQEAMPCGTNSDCFMAGQICCPHYCDTRVCKNRNEDNESGTKKSGRETPITRVVPENVKHRQNVPTIDELAADVKVEIQPTFTLKPALSEKSPVSSQISITLTPSIQSSLTGISATAIPQSATEAETALPMVKIGAAVISPSVSQSIDVTATVQPYVATISLSEVQQSASVQESVSASIQPTGQAFVVESPPSIQLSPIKNLVYTTGLQSTSIVPIAPSASVTTSPLFTTVADVTVSPTFAASSLLSATIQASIQPTLTFATSTSTVTVTVTEKVPIGGRVSLVNEDMETAKNIEIAKTIVNETAPTTTGMTTSVNTVGSTRECPALVCSNSCMYGRKVDALGCSVCVCLYDDKCPRVLPIPRILCVVRFRMTSSTCDKDADCTQSHICCPGACGNNVCRRVKRETFRTLVRSIVDA